MELNILINFIKDIDIFKSGRGNFNPWAVLSVIINISIVLFIINGYYKDDLFDKYTDIFYAIAISYGRYRMSYESLLQGWIIVFDWYHHAYEELFYDFFYNEDD